MIIPAYIKWGVMAGLLVGSLFTGFLVGRDMVELEWAQAELALHKKHQEKMQRVRVVEAALIGKVSSLESKLRKKSRVITKEVVRYEKVYGSSECLAPDGVLLVNSAWAVPPVQPGALKPQPDGARPDD